MAGKQCSEIINLLFDGFTDNTHGHFTRCSHFSSQLVKYLQVLSVKPSNKVYQAFFFPVSTLLPIFTLEKRNA